MIYGLEQHGLECIELTDFMLGMGFYLRYMYVCYLCECPEM